MDKQWLLEGAKKQQLASVLNMNKKTERYGLSLSEEEARELTYEKNETLKIQRRVELGTSVLPMLIEEFCDSSYISQNNYKDTLIRLQDIFFEFKSEMEDEITDQELLHFMREQFDGVCFGDLDYLEGTCLEIFASAIRAGYGGYHNTDGRGEFSQFDMVVRWDRGLYEAALEALFG